MSKRTTKIAAALVLVVALALVLASVARPTDSNQAVPAATSAGAGEPAASVSVPPQGIGVDLSRRIPDDPLAKGAVDAPVVLIEYADFRCPFCGVFARESKPKLQPYIDAGTLRVEWRDFPLFGEESDLASMAGRAAGEQGRFWEFYEVTFANAPERGHLKVSKKKLIGFAEEAGVEDLKKFEADLSDTKLAEAVQRDVEEGQQLGITGTPTFLVNDEPLVGAQPYALFEEKIERLGKK